MNVVGLITEYNPFHNGHNYHIEKAKELTGADYVVVVMSGNFVQRGTPAIVDKYTRTKMALSCGADMVIELPVIYATASAESFAYGSVSALDSLGCVNSICFGSECGDIQVLTDIASILNEESDSFKEILNQYLKQGEPYPIARKHALLSHFEGDELEQMDAVLSSPNNILGIEYIKAIHRLHSSIVPYTVTRHTNEYHCEELTGTISSASAIRNALLHQEESDLSDQLPAAALEYWNLAEGKTLPILENDFSSLLYYKLLYTNIKELTGYLDVNEEFAKRIKNKQNEFTTLSEFATALKSKNVTHTRVTRSLLHLLLEIKEEDLFPEGEIRPCPYLRLLGMRKTATHLIKKKGGEYKVPIITKVADAPKLLSVDAMQVFEKDLNASHLYRNVCHQKFGYLMADEFRSGTVLCG